MEAIHQSISRDFDLSACCRIHRRRGWADIRDPDRNVIEFNEIPAA